MLHAITPASRRMQGMKDLLSSDLKGAISLKCLGAGLCDAGRCNDIVGEKLEPPVQLAGYFGLDFIRVEFRGHCEES